MGRMKSSMIDDKAGHSSEEDDGSDQESDDSGHLSDISGLMDNEGAPCAQENQCENQQLDNNARLEQEESEENDARTYIAHLRQRCQEKSDDEEWDPEKDFAQKREHARKQRAMKIATSRHSPQMEFGVLVDDTAKFLHDKAAYRECDEKLQESEEEDEEAVRESEAMQAVGLPHEIDEGMCMQIDEADEDCANEANDTDHSCECVVISGTKSADGMRIISGMWICLQSQFQFRLAHTQCALTDLSVRYATCDVMAIKPRHVLNAKLVHRWAENRDTVTQSDLLTVKMTKCTMLAFVGALRGYSVGSNRSPIGLFNYMASVEGKQLLDKIQDTTRDTENTGMSFTFQDNWMYWIHFHVVVAFNESKRSEYIDVMGMRIKKGAKNMCDVHQSDWAVVYVLQSIANALSRTSTAVRRSLGNSVEFVVFELRSEESV